MSFKGKCKKCLCVIDAIANQIISCKCGEITFEGVSRTVLCSTDTSNYIDVDENGNEILKEESVSQKDKSPKQVELLGLLDNMIQSYEDLPEIGKMVPINHYDLLSILLLVRSLFSDLASETSLIKESIEAKVEASI